MPQKTELSVQTSESINSPGLDSPDTSSLQVTKQNKVEELEDLLLAERKEYDKEKSQLERVILQLNSKIESDEVEISRLRSSLDELTTKIEKERDAELASLKVQITNLEGLEKRRLSKLPTPTVEESNDMNEMKIVTLENEIVQKNCEIEKLVSSESSLKKEKTELNLLLKRKENEAMSLMNSCLQKDTQVDDLQHQVEDLIDKAGTLAEDFSSLKEENEALKQQLSVKEELSVRFKKECDELKSRGVEMENRLNKSLKSTEAASQFQKRNMYLNNYTDFVESSDQEVKIRSFGSDKFRDKNLMKKMKNFNPFSKNLKIANERILELENRVHEMQINDVTKNEMIKQSIAEQKRLKDVIQKLELDIQQLKTQIKSLEFDLKDKENEAEVGEIKKKELENKIDQLNVEILAQSKSLDELTKENDELKRKNEAMPESTTDEPVKTADTAKFEKYLRMQKTGLPEGAIRHALMRDGLDPEEFFNPESTKKKESEPSVVEADRVTFAKYYRLMKAKLPEDAIRHALIRDGFDPEEFFNPKAFVQKESAAKPKGGFLADISKKPLLKKVDVKEKTELSSETNALLEEIKKKGKSHLKKTEKKKVKVVQNQQQTIAELCKLKAAQRAQRSVEVSELLRRRSVPKREQSELQKALKKRAEVIENSL